MTTGHLDHALVRRHLAAIDRSVQNLRKHSGRPREILQSNLDEAWAVERGLQLCAQNTVDVATHIAAAAGLDAPDYTTAIDRLGELGILPPEFARRFRSVAGFRNVLVHGYLEVDFAQVHSALNERLGDFTDFARFVDGYLRSTGEGCA